MDARLREGIRLFNEGRYFESHESLEDSYRRAEDKDKPFLEGLIQLAVACRIFCDFGEVKGPVRMVRQAIIRLENYRPLYLNVKVQEMIEALEAWTERAEADGASAGNQPPQIQFRRFGFF